MQKKTIAIIKRILKVIGWITGSIVVLLLVIIGIVQLPAVQQMITQKAVGFLEKKIGTDVNIESLYISFPKNIVLKGLFLEDQAHDTLLYAGELTIDTDLWALTQNEIQLNSIHLENTTAFIKRTENDSAFNFTYITHAFAGDSTAVPDTLEQKGWIFSLEQIQLENIKAHYHDLLTGNHADVRLGAFDLGMDQFDLENYIFSVESIYLEDTQADLLQTKLPEITQATAEQSVDTMVLDLNLNELGLQNVRANYTQQVTGQRIRLDVGETVLKANKIDLKNQRVDLDRFDLKNTFIAYQSSPVKNAAEKTGSSSTNGHSSKVPASGHVPNGNQPNWKIKLGELNLEGNSLQFYDHSKPATPASIDFDHLWITNLNGEANDLVLDGTDIMADIKNLSFREKSGFQLQTFTTALKISNDSASLKHFQIVTGNSKLQMEAGAGFDSFETLSENFSDAKVRSEINSSYIGIRDLLYFSPTLLDSLPLHLDPTARILVDASMTGAVNDLSIHHLTVRALSDTQLKARGKIVGLPDASKMSLDLSLEKFYTIRYDIQELLPDTLLPDSISIPAWVNVNGTFRGNTKKAAFKTSLTTSIGAADMNGNMNLDSASASRGFEAQMYVNEFDLGALLMQEKTIGKLNLQASLNSHGLTRDEMAGAAEATVESFEYKGYRYENFKLTGKVQNDILTASAHLKDKNLDFTLAGDYNFQEEIPRYDFTFDLKNADFKALQLTPDPVKMRGTIDVNMATADFRILNGSVDIRKVAIYNGDKLYAVDSLLFASIDQTGSSEMKIDSDLLEGRFEGTFNVFEMPAAMREYFNSYYSLHDSVEQSYESPQRFSFNLKLKKTELLTDIIAPDLSSFEPGEITGMFDSKTKNLELRFDIENLQYSNIGVDAFTFSTNSDSSALNYNIFVDKIRIDSLLVDGLEFNGTVAHDSIRTNVIVLDSADTYKYVLGGIFYSREKEFELRLDPKQIKLNYHDWSVPVSNYIRFGGEKIVAQNVELVNGREKIIFESKPQAGSPLFIGFRELNLEYLSSMVSLERPMSGLLHGDINLFTDKENLQFTSDIGIKDFRITDIQWGDFALAVEQTVKDRFDVKVSLIGKDNDLRAKGSYAGGEKPALDLTATIGNFDLAVLQPLGVSQVRDLKGKLTGEITVKGSPVKPDVNGEITFSDTEFFSEYLKTPFRLKEETITLNDRGISFDKFELIDSRNNIASLDGMILTTDYKNFAFRLTLNTNNFRLLNTTAKDNELFYGTVEVNANVRIRGDMDNPTINSEISLSDNSHLTYVVPQSEASILEQQGIVKFIDRSFEGDPFMKKVQKELADTVKSEFTGIDLTARIELNDQETLTIIIDPTTNDQLTIKGNATLTMQMDRTGDIQLSGRYEISEGTYNLSFYKFVKREFEIENGSTITWTGDPLNANMDIRAIFKVEAPPADLFANQGLSQDQQNQYRNRLPFLVYLNIGGELLTPEISFRLDMPERDREIYGGQVYAVLSDINTRESELNKQVFSLLILKRFVADNPFESGSTFANSARSSVSQILADQLNRLSENVKGVELSFDVNSYEDYTKGGEGQTELQLGLSKSLLNDRLIVKVSSNIDIEGKNSNQSATDYIGDLAVEYTLTKDGRFRITGFSNSNYDMIDGELTETGAGLIYIKDYNTLSELFRANVKQKK